MKFLNYFVLYACLFIYSPTLFACDQDLKVEHSHQEKVVPSSSVMLAIDAFKFIPSPRPIPTYPFTGRPRIAARLLDVCMLDPLKTATKVFEHNQHMAARQKVQQEQQRLWEDEAEILEIIRRSERKQAFLNEAQQNFSSRQCVVRQSQGPKPSYCTIS